MVRFRTGKKLISPTQCYNPGSSKTRGGLPRFSGSSHDRIIQPVQSPCSARSAAFPVAGSHANPVPHHHRHCVDAGERRHWIRPGSVAGLDLLQPAGIRWRRLSGRSPSHPADLRLIPFCICPPAWTVRRLHEALLRRNDGQFRNTGASRQAEYHQNR